MNNSSAGAYQSDCRDQGSSPWVLKRRYRGLAVAAFLLLAGCDSGGGGAPAATPLSSAGTTPVTLMLGSTANDRLAEYDVTFQGITLTSQSGQTVTLLGSAQKAEFIHVNSAGAPMFTVAVPQDVYSSATVTISSASLTCLSLAATGGLVVSTFVDSGLAPGSVTVALPAPIRISGVGQALLLNMQVSQSAQLSDCAGGSGATYSFTPTFTLSDINLPEQTSASVLRTLNGQIIGLSGSPESMQLQLAPQSPSAALINVQIDAGTILQGFSTSSSGLPLGLMSEFVRVDGSLQPDGSILASRIALQDLNAIDVQEGPILMVDSATPYLTMYPLMQQGQDQRIDAEIFDFAGASFSVDEQFTNLASLPFTPSFTAVNVVAGQNVYISSPAFNHIAPPNYNGVATTITLEPQTIDGTIVGTATSGRFTVYTVQLAAYDLFPALAIQAGQTTRLNSPATVQVYADAKTQQFSASSPAIGATLRFFGLVFNDGGTLRMDCARINDGVPL